VSRPSRRRWRLFRLPTTRQPRTTPRVSGEHIAAGGANVRENVPEMCDLAEAIRKIAGDSELALYRYRDLTIGLGALYEEIRGAREWRKKE